MTTVVMRQQGVSRAAVWFAILTALAGSAAGCKSGTSWTSKPSWWSFGGGTPDAAKLADAPPAGEVSKPSATAKPYPITSTPEGYVLSDKQRVEQASAAAAIPQSPPPAATAVTYGSTPPATTASTAAAPQGPPATGGLSSITPQVGPYGSPSAGPTAIDSLPATASAASSPPLAPMQPPPASAYPGAAPPPAAVGGAGLAAAVPAEQRFGSPAERVADARSAPSWQAPPETAPQAPGSRYDTATGSRFSGGGFSAPPPAPAADPFAGQPAAMLPPPASFPPAAPPAAVSPPAVPPPPAMPATLPPTSAPSVPTRRPDPGYRPGGTSSYRPSRTILAGGEDAGDAAVQPASFQTELPAAR